MDPVVLPDEIPLQSFKVVLDYYKGRKTKIDNELLAAAITIVGFCGVEMLPLIGDELPPRDEVCHIELIESISTGQKMGLIPWEKIARAIVDEILDKVFGKK